MRRRKYLIGMGSLAAGSVAAVGTGAFGVQAKDRDAIGTISNDNNAYLGLKPGQYSVIASDGELEVRLNSLNQDSTTELDDVFHIQNDGTENVEVQITNVNASGTGVSVNDVFVSSDASANGIDTGDSLLNNAGANLAPGEEIGVGINIDVPDAPAGQSNTVMFDVDADGV